MTHLLRNYVVPVHNGLSSPKDAVIAGYLDLLRKLVRRITGHDLPAHHMWPPLKPSPPPPLPILGAMLPLGLLR